MSVTVFLVRHAPHGDVGRRLTGRAAGHSLGAEGRAVADRLAGWFGGVAIGAVQSSPLERAYETAAPIAAAMGATVEQVEALTEIDFGEWTGAAFADLDRDPRWQLWNEHRADGECPGGERMSAVQARIVDHFLATAAAADPAAGAIVMVTHGDLIRATVARLLGLSLDHIHRFDVDPASITEVTVSGDQARLVQLNQRIY